MTGITPTPWVRGKQHPCRIFSRGGGNFMATTCLLANEGTESQQEIADARYIVAAVNACSAAGLTVEELESGVVLRMFESQRTPVEFAAPKLLDACKAAKQAFDWAKGGDAPTDVDERVERIARQVDAAIKAAEGEKA